MNKYTPLVSDSLSHIGCCYGGIIKAGNRVEHELWDGFYDWALSLSTAQYEAKISLMPYYFGPECNLLVY